MIKACARRWMALAVAALAVGGCDRAAVPSEDDRPLVVTTTGMIADVAARVAGEHARVEALMGPGVDPHLFKPTQGDVQRLAAADLILYNGLHLEGRMGDILEKMGRDRPVVAVAEAIPVESRRESEMFAGQYDPHVWFDVSLWAKTVSPTVEALSQIDPAHADRYRANAAALEAELAELDSWVMERIGTIPAERRVLVTAHDAFGYFGRRYGLEVMGLQGISTVSEASLRDVERIVDVIVERRIPAIFVESSVPPQAIEAVREAVRQRGFEVRIGGELFSDAMGAPGTPEGTYPGMVRHNVEAIVSALADGGEG